MVYAHIFALSLYHKKHIFLCFEVLSLSCRPHVYTTPVNCYIWLVSAASLFWFCWNHSSPLSSPCFPCIGWGQLCSIPWTTCHNISWQALFPWKRMSPWVRMPKLYLQLNIFGEEQSAHTKANTLDCRTLTMSFPLHPLLSRGNGDSLAPHHDPFCHWLCGKDECKLRGCWMETLLNGEGGAWEL